MQEAKLLHYISNVRGQLATLQQQRERLNFDTIISALNLGLLQINTERFVFILELKL